jgi:hypothetical protein
MRESLTMPGKLVSMAITEIESGETTLEGYYMSDIHLTIETIVKIKNIQVYKNKDSSYQILIDGLALDGGGYVFPINLNFDNKSKYDKIRLLNDLNKDKIFKFYGNYGILPDAPLTLLDPEFSVIESKELEKDAKLSFKHNINNMKLYKY